MLGQNPLGKGGMNTAKLRGATGNQIEQHLAFMIPEVMLARFRWAHD